MLGERRGRDVVGEGRVCWRRGCDGVRRGEGVMGWRGEGRGWCDGRRGEGVYIFSGGHYSNVDLVLL